MKLFVVTDVHGHYTLLKQALDGAGFRRDDPEHLLVCCGDYFDRGTENLRVLQFFDGLENKVLLRGNHEDLLLKVLDTGKMYAHNYINGSEQTVLEFFGRYSLAPGSDTVDFSGNSRMRDRVTEFILSTQDYFETENYVFVHAWLPTQETESGIAIHPQWRQASPKEWAAARWTKWTDMYDTCDRLPDKTIVCGHLPSFYAEKIQPERHSDDASPFCGNGFIALDAGTFTSQRINVLVLEEVL